MHKFTQGLILHFERFWNCLINTGIDKNVSSDELKYVRFTNVVAALTAIAVFFYIPLSLYQKNYLLAILQMVDVTCVLSVIWINHAGYHKTSRQIYLLFVNSFVLINACFIGNDSRVHDFFYISYVVPFLLFRVKDYFNIVLGILIAIVAFNVYQHIYPHFTAYNVAPAVQKEIYSINVWMKFVLFGIAIYVLAYYNYASEMQLEISNKKLEAQADELKRSNQDLEQFAYIISHDLKAPVRSIGSFMKLLQNRYKAVLPEEAREFVSLSKASAERLSAQIDDLLSYCRVGMNLPPAAEVDLNEMIKTIQVELGEKIKESNARIVVQRKLPVLKNVHTNMLHHVLQNLVANGIKFNKNPNPVVAISYKDNGDTGQLMVRDNGIGIEPGFEEKLFQMFSRLHTHDQFEGTGIGLAVCKKIVNFYNGNIWFESTPGQGTTFYFSLPKAMIISPNQLAKSSSKPQYSLAAAPGGVPLFMPV
jgi:signal transduction histidine kinase